MTSEIEVEDYVGRARAIGVRWAEGITPLTRQRVRNRWIWDVGDAERRMRMLEREWFRALPRGAVRGLAAVCLEAAAARFRELGIS